MTSSPCDDVIFGGVRRSLGFRESVDEVREREEERSDAFRERFDEVGERL